MKTVVISQRIDFVKDRDEIRDALDQRMIEFATSVGCLPIPIPNALGKHRSAWIDLVGPAAVILSGGNDVGEFPARDETELALLDYAHREGIPVFGICRGMQIMAKWAGSELKSTPGHVNTVHAVSGVISGLANSFHAYSIRGCPEGFEVTARSHDGEIEAIRHAVLPWIGCMWHPERDDLTFRGDGERFLALLACE